MLTRKVRIDLDPNSALAVVNCNQYDEIANCLEISLFKNSQAFNVPNGATVKIQGTKPDMHGFQYDAKSFSGNTVICDLTQQMTAVAGEVPTEIRILDTSDNTAHTANFILQVEESALSDDTIMSDTDISGVETLREIVERLDDVTQDVAAAQAAAQQAIENAATATIKAGEASASATNAWGAANESSYSAAQAKASETNANASSSSASRSANSALNYSEAAEAWAIGKYGGTDVPATHEAYHNNSKYYAQQASVSETTAKNKALDAASSAATAASAVVDAQASAQRAEASATTSSAYAMSANTRMQTAEAWAIGKRDGVDVPPDDQTYHNNSKYYAEQASASMSDASTSAQTAITKATEAATSASNASTSETNAQNSATTATTKATEASASADRAEQAAQSTEGVVKWSERKWYVGKNLLKIDSAQQTKNGITLTVNEDGSISLNGTATQNTFFDISGTNENPNELSIGKYILSGAPTGSMDSYFMYFQSVSQSSFVRYDTGNGVEFDITDANKTYCIKIAIRAGQIANNLTFYPMLRYASITDDTYEPYLPKNDEIAAKAFSDVSWEEQNVLGTKNLLPMPWVSTDCKDIGVEKIKNGITYKVNEDYSITLLSGTATANTWIIPISIANGVAPLVDGEEYILSGRGGASSLYITDANQVIKAAVTAGNEESKFIGFSGAITLNINIQNGATISEPQTYKPMIRLASIKDPTYTPYSMTNRELTEKVQGIDSQLGVSGNVITDIDDISQITKHFKANSSIILPFTSAALNKPEGIGGWGYLQVYFGGDTNHFIETLVSAVSNDGASDYGRMYMRCYTSGVFRSWKKVTLTTVT